MHKKVARYRKRKATKVRIYDPWDFDAEEGDLAVDGFTGELFRLEENHSNQTAKAGILYPRTIKPPRPSLVAKIIDDEIWWVESTEES